MDLTLSKSGVIIGVVAPVQVRGQIVAHVLSQLLPEDKIYILHVNQLNNAADVIPGSRYTSFDLLQYCRLFSHFRLIVLSESSIDNVECDLVYVHDSILQKYLLPHNPSCVNSPPKDTKNTTEILYSFDKSPKVRRLQINI